MHKVAKDKLKRYFFIEKVTKLAIKCERGDKECKQLYMD